jgi:pyrroline-5-carboxylate reductase
MVDIGRVGIIGGAGWLGHAIAKALIGSSTVSAERLICSLRRSKPESAVDCNWTQDNRQSVANSNVVILSVRPGDRNAIDVAAGAKLVISVMAGVSVDDIKRRPGSSRVARALPNLAAEIGYSYTPFFVASPKPASRRPSACYSGPVALSTPWDRGRTHRLLRGDVGIGSRISSVAV